MKACLLFVLIIFTSITFSQNVSPQFSELKGMEDQSGNTHLFYRIYTSFENDPIYEWSNHIYHWNLIAEVDTLFITASGIESPGYNYSNWVSDVDYWENNTDYFIYSGGHTFGPFFEGSAYVQRFDGFINYFGAFWGSANYIDVSPSNDSLLFLGINTDGGFGLLSSSDGGRSWDSLSVVYQFLSLNPYYENIYFVEDSERKLFRTTDNGITFNLVDPEFLPDTRLFYDPDQQHIYRKANNKLIVSDNLGEQFSWETKYTSPPGEKFYISVDYSISGTVYLADGKNIYVSTDYGDNFNLYKSLDRNIVGIYKKPNSDKLYAATKYKIDEIRPDSTTIIKQLPAIDDLKWYPFSIGNKWIYKMYREQFDPPGIKEFIGIATMEVIGDTILDNQKRYFKLANEPLYYYIDTAMIRPDSLEGKLYIYLPDVNEEVLYEDFFAQVGDTTWIDSVEYKVLIYEDPFEVWGMSTFKRTVDYNYRFQYYELVKNVGLFKWGFMDFFAYYTKELCGCIIDGIVYGDTTVVLVEDETLNLPAKFSLSQNYPNPFNPSTTIKFTLPSPYQGEGQGVRSMMTTLKVYDILGNEVATLVNEELPAGTYEVEFDASSLTSGVYFYRLTAGTFADTKKLILLK